MLSRPFGSYNSALSLKTYNDGWTFCLKTDTEWLVVTKAHLEKINKSYDLLASGNYNDGMELLVSELRHAKRRLEATAWENFVATCVLTHPIRNLIHQCPFTRHAYSKPRGYPGDAVLLDHIYGLASDDAKPQGSVSLGIYQYTINAPAPRAVRYRRNFIADLVHNTLLEEGHRRVLSIASGHLREAQLIKANGTRFEWLALDQDDESLLTVAADYSHLGVRPIHQNIRNFIAGRTDLGKFDLIYAAGLFDYLANDIALRLLSAMVKATTPGGRVLIANFMPDIPDIGYMESFMAWRLIYRTPSDLSSLVNALNSSDIADLAVTTDPDENVAFAVLTTRKLPVDDHAT